MKRLTIGIKNNSGRNNTGKITVHHIGSGNKLLYRIIDNYRRTDIAIVEQVIYDRNSTTKLALIRYLKDNMLSLIKANHTVEKSHIINNLNTPASNCAIGLLPINSIISNIETNISKGAKLVKSALSVATIVSKSDTYVTIKINKRLIQVPNSCIVTVGQLAANSLISNHKAGNNR